MTTFLQAASATLLAVVLILSFRSQGRDIGLLLSVFLCCALGCLAASYLAPVIQFMNQLQTVGGIDDDMMLMLLKVVGIAFLSEIASLVCTDSGNSAMGKALQYLAVAIIMYLSLPAYEKLLDQILSIMENI